MSRAERLWMLGLLGSAAFAIPVAARTADFRVVYQFRGAPADAAASQAGLLAVGGLLYGTGFGGGANGAGSVFSFDPATGGEALIASLTRRSGYGEPGEYPDAGLIDVGGLLYGTAELGGRNGGGSVYEVDPATGEIASGQGLPSGSEPRAPLTEAGGAAIYGTTFSGGTEGLGTVFAFDPVNGTGKTVYSFTFASGDFPQTGLSDIGGVLYGTTSQGGLYQGGTVYTLEPKTGTETILHSFSGGSDGEGPFAGVIAVGDTLFGTTAGGSPSNDGTVFAIDRKTGAETVLHSFTGGRDGASPMAGLIDVGGTLYGTTYRGGDETQCGKYGCGTVFAVDPNTGEEKIVHAFNPTSDGNSPSATLIDVGGALYGTTGAGGDLSRCSGSLGPGCGTIFAITP